MYDLSVSLFDSVRCFLHYGFFFFFKQKTAYEMRISDWSSDVCSSDLMALGAQTKATGTNSIVIGGNFAEASGTGAIAIGTGPNTKASADNALALGSNAAATNQNSVALGAGSTTDRDNSVSVGSAGNGGPITHVAAGTPLSSDTRRVRKKS